MCVGEMEIKGQGDKARERAPHQAINSSSNARAQHTEKTKKQKRKTKVHA